MSFSRLLSAGYRSVFYSGFWFSFRPAKLVSPAWADGICAITQSRPFEAADKFIWGQWDSISLSPLASPGAWAHFSRPPFGRSEVAPGGAISGSHSTWWENEDQVGLLTFVFLYRTWLPWWLMFVLCVCVHFYQKGFLKQSVLFKII